MAREVLPQNYKKNIPLGVWYRFRIRPNIPDIIVPFLAYK